MYFFYLFYSLFGGIFLIVFDKSIPDFKEMNKKQLFVLFLLGGPIAIGGYCLTKSLDILYSRFYDSENGQKNKESSNLVKKLFDKLK